MSVLIRIMSFPQYLRFAIVRFPLAIVIMNRVMIGEEDFWYLY